MGIRQFAADAPIKRRIERLLLLLKRQRAPLEGVQQVAEVELGNPAH
jgi:hypothetical protein